MGTVLDEGLCEVYAMKSAAEQQTTLERGSRYVAECITYATRVVLEMVRTSPNDVQEKVLAQLHVYIEALIANDSVAAETAKEEFIRLLVPAVSDAAAPDATKE